MGGGSFAVLVATDGSPDARAAVAATVTFPWPRGTRVTAVVGRGLVPVILPRTSGLALEASLRDLAEEARRALATRWRGASVSIGNGPAARVILDEARRRRARVIVLGARGHGMLARMTMGSVSRDVVRGARRSVLVVRGTPGPVRQVVIGVDGSNRARKAVELVAGLAPGRGARATVVQVLEPVRVPSLALLPAGVREALSREAAALHARRLQAAERQLDAAVSRLGKRWRADSVVRIGVPSYEVLRVAQERQADLVVVGARGTGGLEDCFSVASPRASSSDPRCPCS